MTQTPKVVSTMLYTEGSQKVNDEVEKELKVPDPTIETAWAVIDEHKQEAERAKAPPK